jgi:NADH:ubiquinone oxidoreductase subunit 3 (subunit A)
MKKLLEILVCFLHPLAVVLAWINLLGRRDLGGTQKLAWGVFLIVPVVPFVYIFTGGDLW